MRDKLNLLEEMLFNTMFSEIEKHYEDVMDLHEGNYEILSLAHHLRSVSEVVGEVFREIPNPRKRLGTELYTPLYEVLRDIDSILYDLSIAEGEQLGYVIAQAYRKLDHINSLFERLV